MTSSDVSSKHDSIKSISVSVSAVPMWKINREGLNAEET